MQPNFTFRVYTDRRRCCFWTIKRWSLYFDRDERALKETADRYNAYCFSIAHNILNNTEDASECVNDVWLAAWNAIPPHRPQVLQTFLGKLARNISLKKWRAQHADKRGGGELPLVYEELSDCIRANISVEQEVEASALARYIDRFLDGLSPLERAIFLRRYWYFDDIHSIAKRYRFTDAKVKSMLLRLRRKLATALQKEGLYLE